MRVRPAERLTIFFLLLVLPLVVFAQTKKPAKKPVKKTASTASQITAKPSSTPSAIDPDPQKKNERPADAVPAPTPAPADTKKTSRPDGTAQTKLSYPFHYEFSQPAFVVSHIVIDHDDNGRGTITFTKRDFDSEDYTDPLQLTGTTMQKLKTWWSNLNFLDSTESYQSSKNFAHLGTIKLRMRREGRERIVEYNWSENKDAKALMDEYRDLGQQYVWVFDMNLARENQPLEAPQLVDTMEGMLRRNEVSDPHQIAEYLSDLSNDERIPLLARNHALKLVKQIEKDKK
jgi:hypothetical protein